MKRLTKIQLLITSFCVLTSLSYAQTDLLRKQIETIVNTKQADVGVAIYGLESSDTLTFQGSKHYPMQSVYKFHLALAVLDQVDKGKLSLDQKILLKKRDLLPNTHSPLRDKYPNGNVQVPLSEILEYTISLSDNNGCDILFRLLGGTKSVHTYIQKLGIRDVSIQATEEEMHQEWNVQFTNWTTPFAVAQLLKKFHEKKVLSDKSTAYLWKVMAETTTGPDRLKGQLPAGTVVAHKTGTSGTNAQGITAAINDAGIVTLPNGKHFAIVVFVTNTKEDSKTNEKIIADIAKAAWDYFTTRSN